MQSPTEERTKVFICYSHRDKKHLDRLLVHLAPLQRTGALDVWADTRILAGQEWRKEICQALASARVAIALVSANFRASNFIAQNELPPLLAAAKSDGVLIIPVVVGACDFDSSELANIQAVNEPSKPLDGMTVPQRDVVWVSVVKRVNQALTTGQALPSISAPEVMAPVQSISRSNPDSSELDEIHVDIQGLIAKTTELRSQTRNNMAIFSARNVRHQTPEAQKVLEYLVLNGDPEGYVALDSMRVGTPFNEGALLDALHELRDAGLIELGGPVGNPFSLARPHVAAWLAIDPQILGYDTNQDMLMVANCINHHSPVYAQSLAQETQLPLKRLNIAALLLSACEIVALNQPSGTRPYAFAFATATYKTRKFLTQRHT